MTSGDNIPLKVTVLGVRGIPNVQGGVETHAEYLYKCLSELGCAVEVLVRAPYVPSIEKNFGSIKITRIWSPTRIGLEALTHSLLGVLYAAFTRPDLLHIHAIGPAIVAPVARLCGLRVVVTHHGPDYDRDKWGSFARWILRMGERLGMRYANQRIVISGVIQKLVREKYGLQSELIPNGVVVPRLQKGTATLAKYCLEPRRYLLQVSRLVPEKRQLDLINAFKGLDRSGWRLVLVGGVDGTAYADEVVKLAQVVPGVVMTNYLRGAELGEIYSHAGAFVLPSSHEGLPIAMLEALSYGLPVLASDIPANLEVGLNPSSYFRVGDIQHLSEVLEAAIRTAPNETSRERSQRQAWVAGKYDWGDVAERTMRVYKLVVTGSAGKGA